MSPLTVENHLLKLYHPLFVLVVETFLLIRKAGLEQTLFISRICVKDFAVNFVFKKFTCQLQNKEYLSIVFRHWLLSCKQFFLNILLKVHDTVM